MVGLKRQAVPILKERPMATSPKKSAQARGPAPVEPDLDEAAPGMEEAVAAVIEPAAEMQDSVRTALEKGVSESRAAFARAKASADEATNAFELSFAAAKDGVIAFNAKALEAWRANGEANLDFIKASLAVKSLADLVKLQNEFARKRVEAVSDQFKDLGALAQKTALEAFEPVKDQVAKSFKLAV
jgi:phasin